MKAVYGILILGILAVLFIAGCVQQQAANIALSAPAWDEQNWTFLCSAQPTRWMQWSSIDYSLTPTNEHSMCQWMVTELPEDAWNPRIDPAQNSTQIHTSRFLLNVFDDHNMTLCCTTDSSHITTCGSEVLKAHCGVNRTVV